MDLKIDLENYDTSTIKLCQDIEQRRNAANMDELFINHFNAEGWKNPMNVNLEQARPGNTPTEKDAGFIHILGTGNKIFVNTIVIDPDKDGPDDDPVVLLKNVIRVE